MSFSDMLAILGGFTVVFHLLKLVWRCWCGFREFVLSELWQVDLRTYGQWAVVTGATSGIGKAYASELAHRGLDVILISRSDEKLEMVAKEIQDQYGRKTRTIQVDFTDGHSIYPSIAEALQGLEIGILVNNVGIAYSDHFAYFLEIPDAEQKITEIINCNMLSIPQMTRLVLPGMVERGRGLIINISSEVGIRPQPLLSLYSATKIFVIYFSQCLHAEYKSKGIIVQGSPTCPTTIPHPPVCGPLPGFHQHDKECDSQLLCEDCFRLCPRGLEHCGSLQLHQRLPVPCTPEHGSHNTAAGLAAYVNSPHKKAT
ncbi:hydroxysteroid (20-beta) dehydrogenase 2 isoform X2 [Micropterus dolomieu]|uniref:hydroxysteroid (20-beta) dehydrogenase 2 isoform X2 n=1 Tax=Micropterus dolomieu TaxID=147949 RepID=UPI001E8D569B|nr:hydroxysteroid (20-beta) dehydrogenase 2 isoform X2 [Micropterus dolomieu]